MLRPHIVLLLMTIGLVSVRADIAWSQNYPVKPVRILAAEPGGGAAGCSPVSGRLTCFRSPLIQRLRIRQRTNTELT